MPTSSTKNWTWFVLAVLVSVLGMWCSSGTMAGYAVSHHVPRLMSPCNYLLNIDHDHFRGTFLFLDGADRASWEWSFVLRRILYPLIAYPFMKLFGFVEGGFVVNVLVNLLACIVFVCFVRKSVGHQGALVAAFLLATYPGIAYWIGLPYQYSMIVPCSLLSFVVLFWAVEEQSLRRLCWYGLLLGILATAYDLLPFFGAGLIFVFIYQRRLLPIVPVGLCMIAPTVLTLVVLQIVFDVSARNVNSEIYLVVMRGYLSWPDLAPWWELLKDLPVLLWHNYLYSNFIFLPNLFVLAVVIGLRRKPLAAAEGGVLFAAMLLFLFLNAAPPYEARWQLRGDWIARLYQPIFVVFVFYLSRVMQTLYDSGDSERRLQRIFSLLVAAIVIGNGSIVFGPILRLPIADLAYYNFYRHSIPTAVSLNTERYGRRPLGFCDKKLGKRKKRQSRRKGS